MKKEKNEYIRGLVLESISLMINLLVMLCSFGYIYPMLISQIATITQKPVETARNILILEKDVFSQYNVLIMAKKIFLAQNKFLKSLM